jgi:2-succinyl-5-enolpyruvyl-6-hydroxy-3-cyclohexene-1-carboxylate synthase
MSNLHLAWARAFFAGLADAGVRHVVLSPGSRSTPLALGATAEPRLTLDVLVDERSAAFFALGQARVTGEPSVLVCTSGTAAGHYLPAVMEACEAHLPLVVLTADRPWEAQGIGAPQTVDQAKLFGAFVRGFFELGLPDEKALSAPLRIAAQAVFAARSPRPGPVHVNAHFRKPLEPVAVAGEEPWQAELTRLCAQGAPRVRGPKLALDDVAVDELVERLTRAERVVLACGPAPRGGEAMSRAVSALAEATGAAVLVDATSQLRFGGELAACHAVGAVLGTRENRAHLAPELLVEIVSAPTDSAYASYVAEHPSVPRVVLASHGYPDPFGTASALYFGDVHALVAAVAQRLAGSPPKASARAFRELSLHAEAAARRAVQDELAGASLTEGLVAETLCRSLPAASLLCLGNSLCIRDVDQYAAPHARPIDVLHQRGVNGIDGLVSGFAGACRARSSAAPAALLLGDVSFLHDLGGLAALRTVSSAAVVVVVDNGGGRIFEELPLGHHPELADTVERCFLTPPRLDFARAAEAFALPVVVTRERAVFEAALQEGLAGDGPRVVVAQVAPGGRERRLALRRRVHAALLEGAPS